MERRGSALGTSHPDTLAARAELAALLARRGAAEAAAEALGLQRSVVEVSETSLGPDHVDTLAARAALAGSILRKAGGGSPARGDHHAPREPPGRRKDVHRSADR